MQKDDHDRKFPALRFMDTDRVAEGQLLDFRADECDVSLGGAHHDLKRSRARVHHDARVTVEEVVYLDLADKSLA